MGTLEALWYGFLQPVVIGVTPLVVIVGLLKVLVIKDFSDQVEAGEDPGADAS